MNNEVMKDENKFNAKGQDGKRKTLVYKPFKSKVNCVEDAVFESGAVKHAAQFMKTLEEISNYVKKIITVKSQR